MLIISFVLTLELIFSHLIHLVLRTKLKLGISPLMLIALFCEFIYSQDLHYSQFYNSPLNLNPALTGIFNGDQRFTASVRDQWRFVPVPWFTFSGAYDFRLKTESEERLIGLGINFNYDRQGDSKLTLASLNAAGSYSLVLSKNHIISGGLLLGVGNRGFDTRNLTWDKQWTGDSFDPSLSSGESFDLQSVTFLETAAGVNYRLQKSSRTKLDLGVSAYHIIQPQTNFYHTENKKLPINLGFALIGSLQLAESFDLQLHGLHQAQSSFRETVLGCLGKVYLNSRRGKETEIHIGMGYRTAGSYIPSIAFRYREWYAAISYDVDKTEFNQILNNNKGGPEVHLRYIITKVKPLKVIKLCPIY